MIKLPERTPVLIIAVAILAAHGAFLMLPDVLEAWDSRAVDRLFRLRADSEAHRPTFDDRVWLVVLDDASKTRLGRPYLTRDDFAAVIENLSRAGATTQAWDMIFAAPTTEDEDRRLIQATGEAGAVIMGRAFLPGPRQDDALDADHSAWAVRVVGSVERIPEAGGGQVATFDALAAAAAGVGYLNVEPDIDGVYRRLPLLLRRGDLLYPGLGLRAVCHYLGVPPERVVVRPGRSITLQGALPPGGEPRDLVIPVDRATRVRVNFAGPWSSFEHHLNFAELTRVSRARLRTLSKQLDGRLVVISDTSTGAGDAGAVPTDAFYPKVGIHVTLLQSVLAGSFLRETTRWHVLLLDVFLLIPMALLTRSRSALALTLGAVTLIVLYVVLTAGAFLWAGLILPVVRPLLGFGLALAGVTAHRYHVEEVAKGVLRNSFEAYFPPALVRRIVQDPGLLLTHGHKKELTVLFSDIKNFTHHSATMDPDRVQLLLNEYFEEMVRIVFEHGGTVDKFIGDGLMVFFGDPEPQSDHALRCVRAAIDMQEAVDRIRTRWIEEGAFAIEIRVGIHTGEVVVGNMGSHRRLSYTALGANVNMAARLESNAPTGGILISEATFRQVEAHIQATPTGEISMKGFDQPVSAWVVTR